MWADRPRRVEWLSRPSTWPKEKLLAGIAWLSRFVDRWRRMRASDPVGHTPLLVPAVAAIIGGLVARTLSGGLPAMVVWWTIGCVALVGWWTAFSAGRTRLAGWSIAGASAALAAAWMVAAWELYPDDELAWRLSERAEPIVLVGTVADEPRPLTSFGLDIASGRPDRTTHELTLAVESCRDGTVWRPTSGRASLVVDGDVFGVRVGTRLRVFGRASRPSPAGNPGEFDFRQRARGLRCLSIVHCRDASCLEMLASDDGVASVGPGWWTHLRAAVAAIRVRGGDLLRSRLSPAAAPLAEAMLLGSRDSLPREAQGDFLVTGTVHILSVSGLHVGILAISLGWMLAILGVSRGWIALVVAVCTGAYMVLVGAETPVVRATIVVWLASLAVALGRGVTTANALAAALLLVYAIAPNEIVRVGSQLSFLSTAVLLVAMSLGGRTVEASDPIDRLIEHSRGRMERLLRAIGGGLMRAAIVGAAVWCVTAPLVAERFHVVTPIAILLNPLVGPLVAAAMACGFLCLASGLVWQPAGIPFGWACDGLFGALTEIIAAAAAVSSGHFWTAGPPAWTVAVGYPLLAVFAWSLPRTWAVRAVPWLAFAAVWCVVVLVASAAPSLLRSGGTIEVTMVSLGHGSGVLVRVPDGKTLLYDAGRLGAPGAAARGVSAVLWDARVNRIDRLVLSHADADHFNAVPELFERFRVGEVVVSREFLESSSTGATIVRALAVRRGIPLRQTAAGDVIPLGGGCVARVLHPCSGRRYDTDNQSSLVLSVEGCGRSLLLTGDLEGEAAGEFARLHSRRWDVLVAPHHGTRTSLPPLLSRVARPSLVLVGNAPGSSWPEVRAAYEATTASGGKVLATADGGAIRVSLSRSGVEAFRHRRGRWSIDWRSVERPGRSDSSSPRERARMLQGPTAGILDAGPR